MTGNVSIAKKRGATMAFKAVVIFFLILCSLVFSKNAIASSDINWANGNYITITTTSYSWWVNCNYPSCSSSASGNIPTQPLDILVLSSISNGTYVLQLNNTSVYPSTPSDTFIYTVYNHIVTVVNGTDLTSTRIIDFTPENNATSTTNVNFSLHAYINPVDNTSPYSINLLLHNVDQNVLLLSQFSPNDIYLLNNYVATSSGDFYFSTTTPIGAGTYTLEASINQTIGFGTSWWNSIQNPLSTVNSFIYHTFIVCDSPTVCNGTTIGNFQSSIYGIIAGIAGNSTGTTTATSTLARCNPFSTNVSTAFINSTGPESFDISTCALALITPDPKELKKSFEDIKAGFLTRVPFGYVTRFTQIITSTSTSALPVVTLTIPISDSENMDIITIDSGDILAGGAQLVSSTTDRISGANLRTVAEPIVQLSFALMVLFIIVSDLLGSHRHESSQSNNNGKDV